MSSCVDELFQERWFRRQPRRERRNAALDVRASVWEGCSAHCGGACDIGGERVVISAVSMTTVPEAMCWGAERCLWQTWLAVSFDLSYEGKTMDHRDWDTSRSRVQMTSCESKHVGMFGGRWANGTQAATTGSSRTKTFCLFFSDSALGSRLFHWVGHCPWESLDWWS